jgi:formylglycine-generating enzyme required for sulfatase activity
MSRTIQYWLLLTALAIGIAFLLSPNLPSRADDKAAAAHKAYTETIPGTSIKFDMVSIPGGGFVMGSPAGEKGRSEDEGPQHPVTIKPFWMGKFEVTWDEYDSYWQAEPAAANEKKPRRLEARPDADAISRPTPPYTDMTFGYGHDGFPAICMTHHAAMEYCRWLSKKTGKVYRLPTEAEWEYACRAGTATAYSFGDDAGQLDENAWHAGNSEEAPHPVGQKKPNPWDLYDMHGNVAEWCIDSYQKDAYSKFPTDKPTLSPVLLPAVPRRFPDVARGGSWADKPDRCRSAARKPSDKSWIKLDPQRPQSIWWLTSAEFVGFRVVRAVEEQDNLKGLRSKLTRESD